MKLRNLLATAALLFTATAAFAGHSIDTDKYDISDFTWSKPQGTQQITVNLVKNNDDDDQKSWSYAVYDTAYYNTFSEDKNLFGNIGTEAYAGKIWLLKEGNNEIALPEGVKELGIVSSHKATFSGDNPSEKFLFYRTKATISSNYVSFGKLDDKGSGNDHAADVTFGSPLPTPVVTLLIALGFGVAFVMYRNRKQAKA